MQPRRRTIRTPGWPWYPVVRAAALGLVVVSALLRPPVLLWVVPLVALLVLAVRAVAKNMGFEVAVDGIRGAHGQPDELLAWSQVTLLAWGEATFVESLDVDVEADQDPDVTTGLALHAVTGSGTVRLGPLIGSAQGRGRIERQIDAGRAAGLVPVPGP